MTIDIQALGRRELAALIAAAERRKELISARRPIDSVRRKLRVLAKAAGYTLEEVFEVQKSYSLSLSPRRLPARKQVKIEPKYRDPENKRNTWTGRGKLPRWLAEKTKNGRGVADFLIPGLGRPTPAKGRFVGQKSVFKRS